ncbi:STELLO glycosyltransferase family protein [Piscinibacter sakaiensis]|uniref:Ata16 protein n=1 Tax=Piscinibacter sakaiensis TaxID=1547922 RepID=A0A0K8NXS3_PISS1|nr:STELLO glycosyltransferase family protein [Piscinibacter sakaiensis]GAP35171.1 Ata16 protein [Piscinibacter sakaiensis]
MKTTIVVTSINPPTPAVVALAEGAAARGQDFWVIGDQKGPARFELPGARFVPLAEQQALDFAYCRIAPARHYARKNVGYLLAIQAGADALVETDDDNLPREGFWAPRTEQVQAARCERPGWLNVYRYFSASGVWPRGLPLTEVQALPPALGPEEPGLLCPIQQGLADENPDVDAIYRLTAPLPLRFEPRGPVALRGAWSPFNSQNTTWFPRSWPLLYLPYHCSFRMTDIWRSFVAQRLAYLNGWHVLYHGATVWQDRNAHDLMRDFEEEIPGYLHNERIRAALEALALPAGEPALPQALRQCYRCLVDLGVVGAAELPLLEAWLQDLADLQARAGGAAPRSPL